MKPILRLFLVLTGCALTLLLTLFIIVLVNSRGKAVPFLDKDGKNIPESISIIKTLEINDVKQRIIIRGSDTTRPVLLYLHGGPGDPEFPFVNEFNPGIEDLFIVCYWDQRGAGLSYSGSIPPESMTMTQFIDDAGKVSEYLIKRFKREKIYLLGHSWGTMLGSFTINKYPDFFYAFIAVGQVGNQEKSEIISYNYVLSKAKTLNDKQAIKDLRKIGPPPYSMGGEALKKMIVERKYVIRYGGAVKKGSFYPRAIKPLIICKEYSFEDKINYLKGMRFTKKYLWDVVMKTNLNEEIPVQKIPVYIIQGVADYETTYSVAKEYFDILQTPVKKFYTFENSAHSPIFEEPEKFRRILKEIITEQKDAW